MPRQAPRWVAATAIALLALAVLVMHGASATAEHIPEGEAAGVRLSSVVADHGDCHGCMPTDHLAAICVGVIGAAIVWRAPRVLGGRSVLQPPTTLVSRFVRTASMAAPYQPDPPWVRLAVIRR